MFLERDSLANDQPISNETQTIEEAQQDITQALHDICANRRISEEQELMLPAHEAAISRLKQVLQNLPTNVTSVSIRIAFDSVTSETKRNLPGWMGSSLYTLQHLLSRIGVEAQEGERIEFEFVVLPNYYPSEIKKLSHGSRARELSGEIRETIKVGYDYGLHTLEIKPYGAPNGMAGIWAINAKPFRVPLQIVESVTLHGEEKPLTSYLEGEGWENLTTIPIVYTQ